MPNPKISKRLAVPTQDQLPLVQTTLSNGNILKVYQDDTAGISNIYAQLINGTTNTAIGNPVAITSSTTAHQIWPQVTPRGEIFFVNTGDNTVYRQLVTVSNSAMTLQGAAAQVPLSDQNDWTGELSHYSVDFDPSSNTTYLYVGATNTVTTNSVLAGVLFNAQGTVASNLYYNGPADYPSASGQGMGFLAGGSLIFYSDLMTQTTRLTIQTGSLGSGANRLHIGKLTDGSRVFAWQRQNTNGSWDVLTRRLSADTVTWLDANEVVVDTLAAGNGEPQPNIIAGTNGNYYLVGREVCPGSSTVGICVREYENNGTLVNTAVTAINNSTASFPVGSFTNGQLSISACQLDANGGCTIVTNANVLSPAATTTINATTATTKSTTSSTSTTLNSIAGGTTPSHTLTSSSGAGSSLTSSGNTNTNLSPTSNTPSGMGSITTDTSNLNSLMTGMSSLVSTPTNHMSNNSLPPQLMSSGRIGSSNGSRLSPTVIGGIAGGIGALFLLALTMALVVYRKVIKPKRNKRGINAVEMQAPPGGSYESVAQKTPSTTGTDSSPSSSPEGSPKSTYADVGPRVSHQYDSVARAANPQHGYEQTSDAFRAVPVNYDQRLPGAQNTGDYGNAVFAQPTVHYDQSVPTAPAVTYTGLPGDGSDGPKPQF